MYEEGWHLTFNHVFSLAKVGKLGYTSVLPIGLNNFYPFSNIILAFGKTGMSAV